MPFIYKRGKGVSEDAGNHTRKRCGEYYGNGDQVTKAVDRVSFCRAAGGVLSV